VYATNGQDHWLLGLQFIFKAYKEPVITHVDKAADSTVTVAIATQGLQDKYCSADPARRAELQRSMEAAALKFAQVWFHRLTLEVHKHQSSSLLLTSLHG
jgi:hypothetical protein